MKKVTIISGPQGSGKSTLSRKIADKKNVVVVDGNARFEDFYSPKLEVIILETHTDSVLKQWIDYALKGQITFRKVYEKEALSYPLPELIICIPDSIDIDARVLELENCEIINLRELPKERLYTLNEVILFAKYALSDERFELLEAHPNPNGDLKARHQDISDADVQNFFNKPSQD